MLYFYHTPKLGPARAMLIERLCYYRGCYYRGSTVCYYSHSPKLEPARSMLIGYASIGDASKAMLV